MTLFKVPGKPGFEYGTDEESSPRRTGLFRWVGKGDDLDLKHILPWYPKVTRFVVRKDHRGKILDTRYTLVIGQHEDTLWGEELGAPESWLRWPKAVGVYDRGIRDALAIIVQNEASRLSQTLAAPAWEGDRLIMPPSDLMPPGYSEAHDAKQLGELVAIGVDNPKLALILGFSYAAPYVAPLRAQDLSRQSFMVHMTGGPREGKSTGLRAAGSLWGLPTEAGLVLSWDNTANFITARLGELGCLPIFLDELSSSGFTGARLKPLLQSALQGSQRGRSTRGGRTKMSAPWNGVMFSTGNDSILGILAAEPAIRSRVIEIPSPIVADGPTAWKVDAFVQGTYGLFQARPLADILWAVQQAERLLDMANGGSERTILQHLSLGVAGAYLIGGKPLADAALLAARDVRDVLVSEMAESGVKPGELLLESVRQAIMSRPGAFPTRRAYIERLEDSSKPDPQIDGYWEAPTAYVLTAKLDGIAGASGITDSLTGLRELKRTKDGNGVPLLDGAGGKLGLRKRLRVGSALASVYAITMPEDEPDSATPLTVTDLGGNTGNTGNIAGQSPDTLWGHWEHDDESGNIPGQEAAEAGNTPVSEAPSGDAGNSREALTSDVPTFAVVPTSGRVPSAESAPTGNITPLDRKRAARIVNEGEHLAHFAKAVKGKYPEATEAELLAGLRTFTIAMGGLNFAGPPSRVGQLLFEKVTAQYGSVPVLGDPPEKPDILPPVIMFNFVDKSQLSLLADRPWAVGMDVNAQFPAVCGSVELGTGEPVSITHSGPWTKADFKRPGYVRLEEDVQFAPGGTVAAGAWVAMPTAEHFNERGLLRATEVVVWPEHRRWLAAWGKVVREGRRALIERGDPASGMALVALKFVYATFLGGFLRSAKYNNHETLRPDWADQLQSLARMNMLRALGKCRPRPVATLADAAYFLLQDNESVRGLAVDEQTFQPGKWKVHRVGRSGDQATITRQGKPYVTTLAAQIEIGSASGISAVVSNLNDQRKEVASA